MKIREPLFKRPVDKRLKAFGVNSVCQAKIDDHFVITETEPDLASHLIFMGCKNVYLWWLSVDNYPISHLQKLENLNTIRCCHNLCQSQYAFDFVENLGVPHVSMLSDFIELDTSDTTKPFASRMFDIAYLPAKSHGADSLIHTLSEKYKLVALQGMSRSQVEETLRSTKLFIDFGHHPGKDRVPREAALCGCIPLVRKVGAAAHHADVPLPDSLLIETSTFFEPTQIEQIVAGVLGNHSKFDGAISNYKAHILKERSIFESELLDLITLGA